MAVTSAAPGEKRMRRAGQVPAVVKDTKTGSRRVFGGALTRATGLGAMLTGESTVQGAGSTVRVGNVPRTVTPPAWPMVKVFGGPAFHACAVALSVAE